MRMNKKLKNLLVASMAASFVLNGTVGVLAEAETGNEVVTESTENKSVTETNAETAVTGLDAGTVEEIEEVKEAVEESAEEVVEEKSMPRDVPEEDPDAGEIPEEDPADDPAEDPAETQVAIQFKGTDNYVMQTMALPFEGNVLSSYSGEVPAGTVFAGWTDHNGDVYTPGASYTFSIENGKDVLGDGSIYQFNFDPYFEKVITEAQVAIQFKGTDNYVMQTLELPFEGNVLSSYSGEVPADKVFAGWTDNNGDVYAPGAAYTFTTENGKDVMGDGSIYQYNFDPYFEDAKKALGYIQFKGMEGAYTKDPVELPLEGNVLSNYTGEIPEGKVFAGWTDQNGVTYAPGAAYSFTTENGLEWGDVYTFTFEPYFEDEDADAAAYIQFKNYNNEYDVTSTAIGTEIIFPGYHGTLPEGQKFTGWLAANGTVYQRGDKLVLAKENGVDMGINEEGIHGYLFSFAAQFEDDVKEIGYIQFEGIEGAYTEVALGFSGELMSQYHGEVPEGKVFAGWTIEGTDYAPGAVFTFSKENAVDMGTNEEGIHGYLFSFKARFEDEQEKVTAYIQFKNYNNENDVTDTAIDTEIIFPGYHGTLPEGQKFTGWLAADGTVYQRGDKLVLSRENGVDMGTNEEGVHGYLFSFAAQFEDEVKEIGYIQFEGIEGAYTEVALGFSGELMSQYHGEVPEGKVFAGWTIEGTDYEPGAVFTFSKENAVDMGTNEEGIHGYLFSFKARFEDEEPETEEPTTEEPTTEEPTTEEPTTEEPATEEPATEEPATEEPVTEEPETEDPETEEPETDKADKETNAASKTDNNDKDNSAKDSTQNNAAVKTGDNTMIMSYVIVLVAAGAVLTVLLVLKRRKTLD